MQLAKFDGTLPPAELIKDYRAAFISPNSTLLGPKFKFAKHGKCGAELSELLPHLGFLMMTIIERPDRRYLPSLERWHSRYPDEEAIEEAIRRLAEVIEDRLELYRAFIAAGALPSRQEGAA